MSSDEKEKYREIIYRLNRIVNRIYDLNISLSSLSGNCKSNIQIDGSGYQVSNISNVKDALNSVSYILSSDVIRKLKEKIK